MSSFRDLKNASGRDSKIVQDFAWSDICVYLGLSKTSYYANKVWKGYFPYVLPSCASSDCRENCQWSIALSVTVVTWIRITALVGLKSRYPFHVSTLVGS